MKSNRVYLLLLLGIMAAFMPALLLRDFSVDLELPFIALALETLEQGSIYAFNDSSLTYAQSSPVYLWIVMLSLSLSAHYALPILLFISLLSFLVILSALDRLLASEFRHQERLLIIVGMCSMLLLDVGVLTARVDMLFAAVQLLAYTKIIKRYQLIHDTTEGQLRPKFGNLSIPLLLFAGIFITGFDALVVIMVSLLALMAVNKEIKRFFEVFRPHYFVIILLCSGLVTLSIYIDCGSSGVSLFFDKFIKNHSLVNAFMGAPEYWKEQAQVAGSALSPLFMSASSGQGILAAWLTGDDLFSLGLRLFVLLNLPIGLCALYFIVRQLFTRNCTNLKIRACIIFVLVSSLTVILPNAEHDLYFLPAAPLLYYYVILSYRSMQEKAMLRRISQNVFDELSGKNHEIDDLSDAQNTTKQEGPVIAYEVKTGSAFLASAEDLKSSSVQMSKPHMASYETDFEGNEHDSHTKHDVLLQNNNDEHSTSSSKVDSYKHSSVAKEAKDADSTEIKSSAEHAFSVESGSASLVLLDESGKPDESVMTEEQRAAARREEKKQKARLKQDMLAREQELKNREQAISEVGSAVQRVGEIQVEMIKNAPEGSQAMLHALAAMQGGKRIGIEITGSGHLLFGLSARTERNPLPIALSAALILPMFAYAALFLLFITDYGNFPVANEPMIGIGLGFLVFMCLPAAMFVINRLMIFAIAMLGLGTLGFVFLSSFALPYVNASIAIGKQAQAVSTRIDKGSSNVLCYFGNGKAAPFYVYDSRIIVRADDSNLELCLKNNFNIIITDERLSNNLQWNALLEHQKVVDFGSAVFVPAKLKKGSSETLNSSTDKGTLPLRSSAEGASISTEVAGKARLQLPLHEDAPKAE